jgi:uncharacterized protein YutE (UPF0331/DUF86 family)
VIKITLNPDLIKEKIAYSKKYLDRLGNIVKFSKEEFTDDFSLQLESERIFEVISQLMLDICTHIVAYSNETPPITYSDCMKKLVNIGVLEKKESNKFIKIIKMRNLLVHQYGVVDLEILYASLKMLQTDFLIFKEKILAWLEK